MREMRTLGSVRGAPGDWRPYRDSGSEGGGTGSQPVLPTPISEVLRGAAWQSDKVEVGRHPFSRTKRIQPIGPASPRSFCKARQDKDFPPFHPLERALLSKRPGLEIEPMKTWIWM